MALQKLNLSDDAEKVFKKLGWAERVGYLGKTKDELLDTQIMTNAEMLEVLPALDQALNELQSKGLVEKFKASKGECYGLTDKGRRMAR